MVSDNGKFLNSIYRDETITSIIEEAINGKFELTFIERCTGQEQKLLKKDLAAIRGIGVGRKVEIETEAPASRLVGGGWAGQRREILSFGRRQKVGYADLRVNEIFLEQIRRVFGNADKGIVIDSLAFHIAPLASKEIEERKLEIKTQSLEQRAELIKKRGFEIYEELKKKYPKLKFTKEAVAQFIQSEEKTIYESLNQEVPPIASYLKHTRKLAKSAERSMQ
jgi:hypothetical protein